MAAPDVTVCPECAAESTPSKSMHEDFCSRSEAAAQERGDRGRRRGTVDSQDAVIERGPPFIPPPEVTGESVLSALAHALESEARLRTVANKAKNALTHAVKRTKDAAKFARDASSARSSCAP